MLPALTSLRQPLSPARYFPALDALRGLAAIMIVYLHLRLAQRGVYLAVDLFFLMSGFVIANAYEARLRSDLTPLEFMRVRLVRLYPLYLFGTVLGISVALAFQNLAGSPIQAIAAAAQAAILAPHFTSNLNAGTFPFNPPAWSLFAELAFNLIYATIACRLKLRALVIWWGVSVFAMAALAIRAGTLDLGSHSLTLAGGLARVSASFTAGVILWRLHRAGRLPHLHMNPLWLVGATMALLLFSGQGEPVWAIPVVVVGIPVIAVLGIQARSPGPMCQRLFALSGEISYPLYAVHYPLIGMLLLAGQKYGWPIGGQWQRIGVVIAPVLAVFAFGVSRVYDRPIRAWLSAYRPRLAFKRLAPFEA